MSIKLVFSRPLVTRRCHQWLSACWSCGEAFCRDIFLPGAAVAYSWWFSEVFGVATVNIFFVTERNCTNIVGWIFSSICLEWLSFAWQFAPLSSGAWRFLSTDISQGMVATCFRCGGYFIIALPQTYC